MPFLSRLVRTAAAATLALAIAEPVLAQPIGEGRSQEIRYRAYLGGAVIGNATLHVETTADGYSVRFELVSNGASDLFTEAEVDTAGSGLWAGRGAQPSEWRFRSRVDDEDLDVAVDFSAEGPETVVAEPPFRSRDYEITPSEQFGAIDPLSAVVLSMFPISDATPCERHFDIFDGRRRFLIIFGSEIRRAVDSDGFLEVDCAAAWRRVAGYSSDSMREPDIGFTVRFRILDDGRVLPVRAWTSTEFGAAIVTMRRVRER